MRREKDSGEQGAEDASSPWSSSSGYNIEDWQRDIAILRNTSDPEAMAALERGRKVVEGLGHYDLDDTLHLTGRPWWNLSLSSDMFEQEAEVCLVWWG